jgi:hypothetical protein
MQPLGGLADIFCVSADQVHPAHDIAGKSYDGLVSRIGSTLISSDLRNKVVYNSRLRFSTPRVRNVLDAIAQSSPVLWMTFRNEGRACENEPEMLVRVARRFTERYPSSAILLDGFSYPADFDSPHYDQVRKTFIGYAQSFGDEIAKICAKVPQVLNVNGFSVPESIVLAGTADYYISSAGSIQHKIGWLHNKPGYIHTCAAALTESHRRWWANQLENGRLPTITRREFVTDTSPSKVHASGDRNMNYKITKMDSFVDDFMRNAGVELNQTD